MQSGIYMGSRQRDPPKKAAILLPRPLGGLSGTGHSGTRRNHAMPADTYLANDYLMPNRSIR